MSTNSMGEEDRQGDQELAAFTDALLKDQVMKGSARPALADVVETLARTIGPQPPPEALRQQLRGRTTAEWTKRAPRPGWSFLSGLLGRPAQRWVWAAATLVVVLAIAVVLFTPTGAASLSATAAGGPAATVVAAALLLVGLVAAGVWFIMRR